MFQLLLPQLSLAFGRLPSHAEEQVAQMSPKHVLTLRNSSAANFKQWVECATGPNEELHAFAAQGRSKWRKPPLQRQCCFSTHGSTRGCFRGVFDGRIRLLQDTNLSTGQRTKAYSAQIIELLAQKFGVRNIRLGTSRFKTYQPGQLANQAKLRHPSLEHLDDTWSEVQAYLPLCPMPVRQHCRLCVPLYHFRRHACHVYYLRYSCMQTTTRVSYMSSRLCSSLARKWRMQCPG